MASKFENPHPTWGVTLDQYAFEWFTLSLLRKRPMSRQVLEDLTVLETGNPSCSTFERILMVPDRPKQLQRFLNDKLAPRCMALLMEYCRSNDVRLLIPTGLSNS